MNDEAVNHYQRRIRPFVELYGDKATDIHIIAWQGFIAGMYIYDIISWDEYMHLFNYLPIVGYNILPTLFDISELHGDIQPSLIDDGEQL